ncbi:SLC13 family permease [Roseateles sp. So40a]|uniref:SLC13 family permease n=1 Tax=Roseateles sp. So40a TaxID=3400226 RepID=UPI003A8917A1
MSVISRVLLGLKQDRFFLALLAGLLIFSVVQPARIASYGTLVDWPTIAALTGLLLLTKGLELSGALHALGRTLVESMGTERAAALFLVATAALLSTVLTNDVALFVVVPLTLRVCTITGMPATRIVIFEALAVNAGSALTPIGNPQNIFLWQRAQVPFTDFIWHQLPLVASLMAVLLVVTAMAFKGRRLAVLAHETVSLDKRLLVVSALLYLPFLIATDMHQAGWAAAAVLVLFLVLRPRVVADLDWGLLLVFVLMFVDLRLLAGLDSVNQLMRGLGLEQPTHLYLASIGVSQLVSNVPATIALAEFSTDWRVIAYGVNVGGFGLMIGSLANLIALRMTDDPRAWKVFHLYAIPALVVATAIGYALLFL